MTKFLFRALTTYCSATLLVSGCGLTVPDMQEFPELKADEKIDEAKLVDQIKCEIHLGVQDAIDAYKSGGEYGGISIEWIKKAVAKVTISLSVDDKSSIAPGITIGHPFQNAISYFKYNGNVTTAQSFSQMFGLQASSDATRQEQIGYTYQIDKLLKTELPQDGTCEHVSNVLIFSDLKIRDFIVNKMYIPHVQGLVYGDFPFTTFSDTITFVVILGANITPIWNFVNISGSSNTPLINALRTRTNVVTITIAQPAPSTPGKVPQLSPEGEAINNAQLIGQAVSNALRSQQLNPH